MSMLKKRITLLFTIALLCVTGLTAQRPLIDTGVNLQPETLRYKVMFKWGLINKKAGTAVLTLSRGNKSYKACLAAHSEPWADRIYRVRDTLNGRMAVTGLTPLFYEKIAHEGNEHKHDVVQYDYTNPEVVTAHCTRKVIKKDALRVDEKRSLESEGAAVDMLSSFYYMRTLPFETWQPGHSVKVDIFSGKQKELLTIVYHGIDNLDINGTMRKTYHITFRFTSKGGAKTSDDMEAWISADSDRRPLRLEGKLPVGKVHCILEDI